MGTLHSLLLAGLVAAPEGAHGAAEGGILAQLGIRFPLIIAQIAGFVLLYVFLRLVLYKPALGMLEQRQEDIRTRYSDADKARHTAEELRREYENRLSQVEAEARDRIHEGIREGQAMRAELISQAQQERERIIQQGHREVASEREKMVYTVRETVATMAVEAAGKLIAKSMDDQTHRALIEEFLADLPAAGAAGNGERPAGEARS